MSESRATVPCPVPVCSLIQSLGQAPNLGFIGRIAVEIARGRQHTGEEERRINRGESAVPDATARLHVQKMIVKTLVSGGVGLRAVRAGMEELQPLEREMCTEFPRNYAALDDHRNRRQSHSDGRDARRSIR